MQHDFILLHVMMNQELSEIFARMAEILEFLGDPADTFRIRAYTNAAMAIKELPESLEDIAREKKLRTIPGIGEGIAKKIEEYIKRGKIRDYELLKKRISPGFFELLEIPFLGPKKVKALQEKLGISNIPSLQKAIEKGEVQKLPGFGEKSAQKFLEGIALKKGFAGRRPIGEVFLTVQDIISKLSKCKDIDRISPAGSFRRSEETVGDIDILVTGKNHKNIMNYFLKLPMFTRILAKGETKSSVLTRDALQVDLRVVNPNQYGSALQYFTGSKKHNVHLRTLAKSRGFKLSEYGFFKGKKLMASKTEEDCYRVLGMSSIPPELRTDSGEIEAAWKHKIPKLIEPSDIKGDLHAHSKWSDGGNTIEEMAREALRKGFEYIAITDHSPSLAVARGLKLPALKKKKKEIDALNETLEIKILFGTEVDILANGSIDYPNEILKMFDIVVASVHSRFNRDNTERIIRAMENPYVHIIGHPSGRLINERAAYPLDYEKIFKKASETGTILEINSHYLRLDLQDIYIREAKRYGVKFSIDTDAHSVRGLWLMELGVAWARRGWCVKEDIVNTLPLEKLLGIVK